MGVSGEERNRSGASDSIRWLEVWGTYTYRKCGVLTHIGSMGYINT